MFPWYHGSTKFKELPEDDRLAIQQIYGSREKVWGDNPRPRIPTTTTTPKTTTTTPRSYYPDKNGTDRNRQWEEHIQREREKERERLHRERERERKRQEWERREWEQREKERRDRQKAREQEEDERNNRRENGVRPYYTTTTTTVATPRKSGHHHNHHSRPNKTGNHPRKQKPETCNTSYDSVTIIRGELFIFKDRVSTHLNK